MGRRKDLSSRERFDLTQQFAFHKRVKASTGRTSGSIELDLSSKNPTLRSHVSSVSLFNARREQEQISDADVQWFLSLPAKIQKQQFSHEERMMFTSSVAKAPRNPSNWPECPVRDVSSMTRPLTAPSPPLAEVDLEKINAFLVSDVTHRKSKLQTPPVESKKPIVRRDSTLATSDEVVPRPPQPSLVPVIKIRNERTGTTKAIKLTPLKLPPPKLSPRPSPTPPSMHAVRRVASSPRVLQSTPATEPEIVTIKQKSWGDEDARRRLREVLATPEMFDQALRFGYAPSISRIPHIASSLRSPSVKPIHSSECSVDEDDLSIDPIDPVTPNTIPDDLNPAINRKMSSSHTGGDTVQEERGRLRSIRNRQPPAVSGREMTIKMTLTRPGLRSPSRERLSSLEQVRVNTRASSTGDEPKDPLALQPLEISDDLTGAYGAFALMAEKENRAQSLHQIPLLPTGSLRRVWKNMKKS